ncbi:MAG: cohesin domain-containing protein [Pyrinomonadaceae bacterium]
MFSEIKSLISGTSQGGTLCRSAAARIQTILAVVFAICLMSVALIAQTTVYDSIPSPLAGNYQSIGFQATQTREAGDYFHLAGTDRLAKTVTITMSDWALEATPANVAYCSANPGKCTAGVGFNHPFTLSFYNVLPGAPLNQKGSLIGRVTQTKLVPWRPVASPNCTGDRWQSIPGPVDTNCFSGYAFNMTFDLSSSLFAVLPNDVIVGIEYNTQTYGPAPIGVDGPYNSLNVAAISGPATIGTDDSLDRIFFSSTTPSWYTDGGTGGVGIFREDTNWAPNNGTIPIQVTAGTQPAAQIINANLANPLANPNAWFFYNDENDTIDNVTLGSMVAGPATPPIGNGSAQISVTGTQRRNLATYQFSGTPLSAIGTLKFSTYNPSAGNGGSANRSGYITFNVDFNGSDTFQRRLNYVPSQNGVVVQNSWQEWDAINGGNAMWSYSGATWPAGVGGGGEPGTTLKTWNQILSQYPGVRMRVTDSFFGIRVGEPYNDGYTENIDAIKFGTPTFLKHFNFDPLPPITYVDDNWVGTTPGTDPDGAGPATNFGYDAFATIQGGIDGVANGGTVNVAGGNYVEDVTINKPNISLLGAGSPVTTITGPHNAGGANTLLVSESGALVDGFTITRSGNTAALWAGNVKTSGINISAPSTGATVQNCTITANRNGIYIGQSSNNNTIRRNVIDNNRTGLHMVDNTGSNLIEENFITNNWTMGVLFRTEGGTAGAATVRNNNITGNWYSEIEYREPPAGGLQNLSGNYLGATITRVTTPSGEPGYTAQVPATFPGGTATAPGSHPTIAGVESAKIDYSPYLNFGGDTQVGTPGFQGNFSSLSVTPDGAQVGATSRVQEGIDLMLTGGTLTVPTATYPGNVNVNKAITVKGIFTVGGTLAVSSAGATLSPGFSPGIINSGNFSLVSGSNLNIELNGNIAGSLYDQVNVTGTVSLGGANLVTSVGYAPTTGHTYTIVNNDGADAVSGIFNGLPEGTVFFVGPNSFRISYVGGTGNDVVLTSVSLCNAVSIPTNITSLTGASVNVPINVDDTSGNGLLSTDFTLTYNTSVLSAPVVSLGTVSAGRTLTVNTSTPGVIIVSVFGTTPFTGSGTLANVSFTVNGAPGTSSPVGFSAFKFNEGTPCSTTSNGLVTVISGTISGTITYGNVVGLPAGPRYIPSVTLNAVGSVNVSTTTAPAPTSNGQYTLSGMGAGAYTVTPSKVGGVAPLLGGGQTITSQDAAVTAQFVANLIPLSAAQQAAADVSGTGGITSFDAALIARWVISLPGSGNTASWVFTPTSITYGNVNTNQTGQDYSAILMGDVTGNYSQTLSPARPDSPEADAVVTSAPTATANSGTEVSIPLTVGDTTGRGITSYQFMFKYDPTVLEPLANPVDLTGTVSRNMIPTVNVSQPGVLQVVVFGTMPITGEGSLLKLRFNTIGAVDSTSGLEWDNFSFNEGNVMARTVDGSFRVTASTDGVINGRVLSPYGAGIRNTRVTVIDTHGNAVSTTTSSFGNFQVAGLAQGETYIVRVESKRYRFAAQTVSLSGNAVTLDMIAME